MQKCIKLLGAHAHEPRFTCWSMGWSLPALVWPFGGRGELCPGGRYSMECTWSIGWIINRKARWVPTCQSLTAAAVGMVSSDFWDGGKLPWWRWKHPQSMTSVCVGHWSLAGSQSDAMNGRFSIVFGMSRCIFGKRSKNLVIRWVKVLPRAEGTLVGFTLPWFVHAHSS